MSSTSDHEYCVDSPAPHDNDRSTNQAYFQFGSSSVESIIERYKGPAQAPTSTGNKPEVEVYRATGIQHPYDRKENI